MILALFLADLCDSATMPLGFDRSRSPQAQLAAFVSLARAAGYEAVHFLIDRLDETPETAETPQRQVDLLEPLLAHLGFIETPGVAFKLFLSRDMKDALLRSPRIRRDRLTDYTITVTWDSPRLINLLNLRLAVYSNGRHRALASICRSGPAFDRRGHILTDFDSWFLNQLMLAAQGSPRRLLLALQLVCEAHVRRCGPDGLIEQIDWETARPHLWQKMPPLLRLSRDTLLVFVGDRPVTLKPLEHRVLIVLAEAGDICDRDTLVRYAWRSGEETNEAALSKAVSRLRQALGDSLNHPLYLHTIKGEGFRLTNYEWLLDHDTI